MRNLAQISELQVSSIYHHFGDVERLFESAQEYARGQATLWCEGRLADLDDGPTGLDALAPLLASVIDDWCEQQRRISFAWRECQLLSARDPHYVEAADQWRILWEDFWDQACMRLGVAWCARLTQRFFDGEALLHLLRWRRAPDRAGLDEMCRGWVSWLGGSLAPPSPWRDAARSHAQASARPALSLDRTGERIAQASATVLSRGGVSSVTHRAVAAEAELKVGVVSYRFRTSADLLAAAFEGVYRSFVVGGEEEVTEAIRDPEVLRDYNERLRGFAFQVATAELVLATSRDPALGGFAAQLRYLRGRTSRPFLQMTLGPDKPVSSVDGAIASSFGTGQLNGHFGWDLERFEPLQMAELQDLLMRMKGGA